MNPCKVAHPSAHVLRKKFRVEALLALPCVCAHFLMSSAHGQVVLRDSYSTGSVGGAPTDLGGGVFGYEINLDPLTEFSAAGHGKLVLVYSSHDGAAGGSAPPNITRVTYGGAALTQAVYDIDNSPLVSAGIFYLDNVASDGTLRIELSASNVAQYGFGLYAVDGLKPGVQDTGTAREPLSNATVTMTTPSGFFVQEAVRNNQALAGVDGDDYETLYNYSELSYRALSQYQVTTAAGDYLAPITNTGANFRRVVTAAFEGESAAVIAPRITSITPLGSNLFGLTLSGEPETAYEFYSSTTLEFDAGTLVENLAQGDPEDPGAIGGTNNSVLTTDAGGMGMVRLTLTGDPADFVRAQSVPPPPPLLSEDFNPGSGPRSTSPAPMDLHR